MSNKIVNGVWKGPRLTNLQKLCIRSYQDHGHEFHLYVHEDVEGIPAGTVVKDIHEVVPDVPKFKFDANLSDYTRVKIINKVGGWYVDLDTVCLRPFDFPEDYAFVSESRLGSMKPITTPPGRPSTEIQDYLSGCIFKAPAACDFLRYIIAKVEAMDHMNPTSWICYGPERFQEAIPKFKLQRFIKPPITFDALNYDNMEHLVIGGITWPRISPLSYAMHFRSSFWTKEPLRPDGVFAPDSLYEQLKRRHGV